MAKEKKKPARLEEIDRLRVELAILRLERTQELMARENEATAKLRDELASKYDLSEGDRYNPVTGEILRAQAEDKPALEAVK